MENNGISEEQCPKLTYGEKILSLSAYEENIDFVKSLYSTKKYYKEADDCFKKAAQSIKAGKDNLVFSSLNQAASKYETARDMVLQFNQESPRIDELVKCFDMMANAATNTASGYYLNNTVILNIGLESLEEQGLIYNILEIYGQTLVKEVEAICAEIDAIK